MKKLKSCFVVSFCFLIVFFFCPRVLEAQEKKVKNTKTTAIVEVDATVVNDKGEAIKNAAVTIGEGALTYYTDENGNFTVKVKSGSKFIIEAPNYETKVVDVSLSVKKGSKIILSSSPLFSGAVDLLELSGGINNTKRNGVGAISSISGSSLETYPTMSIGNSLQGKLLGLMADINTGGSLGSNNASLFIRGLHRGGGDGIITIVDGVERNFNFLLPEEISDIKVLKDPSSKLLYGPRAANGILLITTKKGQEYKRIIRVNTEYGFGMASDYPRFLNSYNYATLYNEARSNDGLPPLYSDKDILGYQNSSGPNDFRYPDLDYYDFFLKNSNHYRKATLEFSGGNEGAKYAFVGGYIGQDGLEKVGKTRQRDRFNVRGDLDIKINNFMSASITTAVAFDLNSGGALSVQDEMTAISTHRPNEYPIFIPETIIPGDSAGYPILGASNKVTDNLYGSMVYGGWNKEQNIVGQFNLGLNFDFNSFLKGLTGKAQLTFDNEFYGLESLSTTTSTYSQRWVETNDGRDSVIMIMRKKSDKNDNIILSDSYTNRTTSFLGSLNFDREFADNQSIKVDYFYNYFLRERTGDVQDIKFLNNVLHANYVNHQKYILDGNLGLAGDNKFMGNNRYSFSYALGLGWIISEEDFLKSANSLDFLKLKVNYGVLSYDGQTEYNLYNTSWDATGTARINNSLNPGRTNFVQLGNPDLKWEKSRELNVGFESLILNKKLWIEANYFNEFRYNIIQKVSSIYSMMYGGFYPYTNWGKTLNQGIEAELRYSERKGDFSYLVGANIIYSKNKILQTDQIDYPFQNLNREQKSSDAMFGYVSNGLYGRDVAFPSDAYQTFGAYGVGDIAYEDLNKDNLITELDQKVIGNSFPRVHLGIDINLTYKGFGIYLLGTAQFGYYNWLNSSYYWVSGEDKYSEAVLDRYHPVNNPNGKYPRLTTSNGSNNYRNSTFWIEKADFFRLKNLELSYTLKNKMNYGIYKQIKFFARGTNLFCLSNVKDHDPEAPNAGLNTYPLLKNLTGGLAVDF
jgi:TonB-linked SusC/RagA family outer membrane protein